MIHEGMWRYCADSQVFTNISWVSLVSSPPPLSWVRSDSYLCWLTYNVFIPQRKAFNQMNKVYLLYFTASGHTLMIKVGKKYHTPYYRSMEKLGESLNLNRQKGSEVYEVFIQYKFGGRNECSPPILVRLCGCRRTQSWNQQLCGWTLALFLSRWKDVCKDTKTPSNKSN